jgi:predicted metal-dependent enzyme (double-stranded beta helix superfamily)
MMRTASSPLSQVRLRQLVQGVAAREHEWLSQVRYDLSQRWYHRLAWDDDHEVWLLSWLPGQRTGFHDHGESSGSFTVARGTLRERTAPGGRPGRSAAVRRGETRSFGPWYVHDVINTSVRPAVSVHAYSPPLRSMRRFEFGPGGLECVTTETAARW